MNQDFSAVFPAGTDGDAILERLACVLDPELDEPILRLGFVRSIRVHAARATVTLELPTSWCAINFAFIMAEDIRAALLGANGIEQVTVRLGDHAAADEIEAAVNKGKPFTAAFPGEGGAGLAALRMTFFRKGFQVRQERLLRALRAAGLSAAAIGALRAGDTAVAFATDATVAEPLRRYLQRRAELGLDGAPDAPLIVDQHGAAVPADQLETYYQKLRTVRVSMEANGSFCRAVLATRRTAPPMTTENGGTNVPA